MRKNDEQVEQEIHDVEVASSDAWYGWTCLYGFFTQVWVWRLRLNIFHGPDPSLSFHDHAWSFCSFPLSSYVEDVLDTDTGYVTRKVVSRFWPNAKRAAHTHRYVGRWSGEMVDGKPTVVPGVVVTIALLGRGGRPWHHWRVHAGKVSRYHWRGYLRRISRVPRHAD
jgi:hypothetical protein